MSTGVFLIDLRRIPGHEHISTMALSEDIADMFEVDEDNITVTEMSGPPIS